MDINAIYAELGTAALSAGGITILLKKYLPKVIKTLSTIHHLLDLADELVDIGEKRQMTADEVARIQKTVDSIREDFKNYLPK